MSVYLVVYRTLIISTRYGLQSIMYIRHFRYWWRIEAGDNPLWYELSERRAYSRNTNPTNFPRCPTFLCWNHAKSNRQNAKLTSQYFLCEEDADAFNRKWKYWYFIFILVTKYLDELGIWPQRRVKIWPRSSQPRCIPNHQIDIVPHRGRGPKERCRIEFIVLEYLTEAFIGGHIKLVLLNELAINV